MFPQGSDLLPPVSLHDAVSDLPVPIMERQDDESLLQYVSPPQNEFQKYIRRRSSEGETEDSDESAVTEHCGRLATESEINQRKALTSFTTPAPTVTGNPSGFLLFDTRINTTTPRIPTVREVARFQCLSFSFTPHISLFIFSQTPTAFPDEWSFAGNIRSRYQQIGVCFFSFLFCL